MKFNINNTVLVKLTDRGRKVLKEQHEQFCKDFPSIPEKVKEYEPKKEDANGFTEFQLWVLMETFGPYTHIGMETMFETEIILHQRGDKI